VSSGQAPSSSLPDVSPWQCERVRHATVDTGAALYLSLLYDKPAAAKYVEQLQKMPMSKFEAKDIFRASGLSLLGISNSHVEHDRKKILAGQSLSPLLLVRATSNQKVIIADGYHRMCPVYSFDEDAVIPCKIV
jgi:hypothetical protein